MSKGKHNPPAAGERRAIGGYYPQYRVAAYLILRALREEGLEWIRLADPAAGRVDDLQIGGRGRVDAFQVKWSRYGAPITFRELTGQDGLIAQLGDGRKRLKELYPRARIVVHLVTNRTPSVADHVVDTNRHTAAFIEEVWCQAKEGPADTSCSPTEAWRNAWEKFKATSKFSSIDFDEFVRDCELEFAFRLPSPEGRTTEDDAIFAEDLRQLTESLFAAVADPQQIIQITRDEMLGRVGWRNRVEFRSRHEFPVDESLYEPIAETVGELERALETLERGYLGVLGNPGSGKSTLLTQYLRVRPERVIRYYAYVPDAQDPLQIRGEATYFLHDLVLALERAGFRVGASLSRFDRAQLLRRFHEQLRLLHDDWRATGRKTVILIDGLDHVERELRPDHSLLLDLPAPTQVPQGVLIVLGSQTDQLKDLPGEVQYVIRQPERRIEMRPLARDGVYRGLERALRQVGLKEEQKERIYQLSAGHPLALGLLVNRLRGVESVDDIATVLDQAEAYTGNIESQYHSYWRQLEQDDELTHLLGMAARLRRVVDLAWIESWADSAAVGRFRRGLAHYFRIEAPDRWYFFHNSFRLFVIKQTLQISPGKIDRARDQVFHRELADRCAASRGYWAWEELYHRVTAEQHDVVLQRARPEWFRQQLLAFRPIEAIETDIRLALRSIAALQDPVALARLNFIAAEMGQRKQTLDNLPLIEFLLSTGNHDIAVEHARDGMRLRIMRTAALRLSKVFLSHGLDSEARRLFELSEPLDVLATPNPVEDDYQGNKRSELEAWASAAPLFRNVTALVGNIRRLRYRSRDAIGGSTAEDGIRGSLLFEMGLSMLAGPRWPDFDQILAELEPYQERDAGWWFWLNVRGWRRASVLGDLSRAKRFVDDVRARAHALELDNEEQVVLAEAVYRINRDSHNSRALLVGIGQPTLVDDFVATETTIAPFLHRFRLNRLLGAFGGESPVTKLVPQPVDARQEGIVYFERAICVIARIWGTAWRGITLEPNTLMRELLPVIRLFCRRSTETREWTGWYFLERVRGEFYNLLIHAVSQHGLDAVKELAEVFDGQWRGESGAYWPAELRRSILVALFDAGIAKDWVVEWLGQLESIMFEGQDVSGRVSASRAQAETWLHMRERERAHRCIEESLRRSLGVGYREDYQLNDWIHWLTLVNEVEPERGRERILFFARAIPQLEESTEGEAARLAANELLKTCFRWSPRRGVSLFRFFINRQIISCADAVCEILSDQLSLGKVPPDVALYTLADFICPIARSGDEELAAAFLNRVAETRADTVSLVRYLVTKTSVFGLPSSRRKWRRGLAMAAQKRRIELADIGLTGADLHQDPSESAGSGLRLLDGSTLDTETVEAQVDTLIAFEALLDRESDDSYFRWEPILKRIACALSLADIDRLAAKFKTRQRAAFTLAFLAECAAQLGDLTRAWALAIWALDASREYGWSRPADGGSRLAAFQALVRADKRRGRDLAYQTLARDGGGGARNLSEILPLLAEDLPVKEIWTEVESYVTALFEGTDMGGNEPDNFGAEAPPNDSSAQAFIDLLAGHLGHAATLVAQSAQRACAKLILNGNVEAQRAIKELLTNEDGAQEHAVFVLEALAMRNPSSIIAFRSEISALTRSRNYAIKRSSTRISNRIGCEVLTTGTKDKLPAVYELALPPPRPDLLGRPEVKPDTILPDTQNARELILPYYIQFDALAKVSGIPRTNIYYRAAQIMEELAPRDTWSAQGERRLRAVLNSAGLQFSFHRPRAMVGRGALFYMVGELLDAGRMSSEAVADLDPLLTFDDPALLLIEPAQRPDEVAPIPRREDYSERNEQWLERIEETCRLVMPQLESGWRVIAEHTTLKILDWELPTEIRSSVVCSGDAPSPPEELFTKVPACQIDTYWDMDYETAAASLAIRNNAFMYDTLGANWIAFNPVVARYLGWRRGTEHMLSWDDRSGRTLAKTIWWTDGSVQHYPPSLDDEIGEGWLVVVSPEAWEALNTHSTRLSRLVRVERRFTEEGEERKKTFDHLVPRIQSP